MNRASHLGASVTNDRAEKPPPLDDGRDATYLAAVSLLVLGALSVEVATGLSSLLAHGQLVILRPSVLGQFIVKLLRHPGTILLPGFDRGELGVPPALFWALLFTVLVVCGIGVIASRRLIERHFRLERGGESGFASKHQLHAVASRAAARRTLPQTRPSLAVKADLDPREAGYFLGTSQPHGTELWASWEASLQLVAPPGSGKTLRVLAPIIRAHPGPILATSTKPDLYEVCAGARRIRGPLFALDPEGLVPSAAPLRWSPVLGCSNTAVAERRAAALVAAGGESSDLRSGGFFRRSATAVLAAYLHAGALVGLTMPDVCRFAARPSDPAPLRILTESGDPDIDWAARLFEHTTGAKETTSAVMRTLDLALGCFRHRAVLELCSVEGAEAFDFTDFLESCGTVFALGKERGAGALGAGPLITAFCEELVVAAEAHAATMANRRLDPPLLACLDEAPSIAPLPSLPGLVADGRGRGITTVTAMQSFSQAVERWGTTGAATMRNATTITAVFGGLSVAGDLDELSRLCGTRTVPRRSTSRDEARNHHSVGTTWVDEPVLSPSAIRSLPSGVALLLWGSLPPICSYLPGTWEGPNAQVIALDETAARAANDRVRRELALKQLEQSPSGGKQQHGRPAYANREIGANW